MGYKLGVFPWDHPGGLSSDMPMIRGNLKIADANTPLGEIFVESESSTGPQEASAFNLLDGSDKNYTKTIAAAGTAYALTDTAAALDFGTTDPVLVIDKAGTYLISGSVNVKYNGATFAAGRTVTIKIRRTNNTAADLTGGTVVTVTGIVTTVTETFAVIALGPVVYTTTNTNDSLTIFGDVSVVPTAGSLDVIAASLTAVRLY